MIKIKKALLQYCPRVILCVSTATITRFYELMTERVASYVTVDGGISMRT